MQVGSWQLAVGSWQWAVGSWQWAVDSGQLTVGKLQIDNRLLRRCRKGDSECSSLL